LTPAQFDEFDPVEPSLCTRTPDVDFWISNPQRIGVPLTTSISSVQAIAGTDASETVKNAFMSWLEEGEKNES